MRINDFEWDEGNALHLQFGHGIAPEEAEEVFANNLFSGGQKKDIMQFLAKHLKEGILLLSSILNQKVLPDPSLAGT